MTQIRAGDLRHRVTIQVKTSVIDANGGTAGEWMDFAINVPAAIRPLSSRELMAAQAIHATTSHEITIRYMPGISPSMRIIFNGRYFNLSRPLNTDERNIELIIPATEGMNNG